MAEHAFVILTHVLNPRIEALIARADAELAGTHDVWVIGRFEDGAQIPAGFQGERRRALRREGIAPDHFPDKGRTPRRMGDNDLQPLWLARERPDYRSMWLIEGDVEFTGSLGAFVRHFDAVEADLLTTNVRRPQKNWANLHRVAIPDGWPAEAEAGTELIGLLAVFRASRALLDAVDRFYAAGGNGHNEWSWAYAARVSGLSVADLADFPIDGRPVYTSSPGVPGLYPGTFRYRPPMAAAGTRPMTLYHPVKDRPVALREYADQIARAGWQLARNALGRGRRGRRGG